MSIFVLGVLAGYVICLCTRASKEVRPTFICPAGVSADEYEDVRTYKAKYIFD